MFYFGHNIAQYRLESINEESIQKPIIAKAQGRVTNIKPNRHGFQVTIDNISIGKHPNIKKVKVTFSHKLMKSIDHGDIIAFKATLFPLSHNILPESFDFGFFLAMEGVQASGYAMTKPQIIKNNVNIYRNYLSNIRHKIYQRLIDVLGPSTGNFAAAVIIGQTKAIPEHIAEDMRKTGTSHILSVSGLHLSLVALIFFISSRYILNCSNFIAYNFNIKMIAAAISILGSFLYLQISGSNIAASRAFIMTSIFMIGMMIERSTHPLRSVLLAGFCILLFMPEYVLHPSFQLSFIAVLCLISGYELYINTDFLAKYRGNLFGKMLVYLLANIYTTLLASLSTAPFIIFHFYQIANYSVVMNIVAVPLMTFWIMPLSIASIILLPFGLDFYVLKLAGYGIDLIIESASFVASLPHAVINLGYISGSSLLVFTIGFCLVCFWQTSLRYAGFLIISCSIFMATNSVKPDIIIDYKLGIISVKKEDHILIYAQKNPSSFNINYWQNWYNKEVKIDIRKLWKEDIVIHTRNYDIALNHHKCQDADFVIVTSPKLVCKEIRGRLIRFDELVRTQIILSDGD